MRAAIFPSSSALRLHASRRRRRAALAAALAAAMPLISTETAHATRWWVAANGSWGTSANWSATSGGAGGAGVPTASDVVLIIHTDATNRVITFNGTYSSSADFQIRNGGSGITTFNQASAFNLTCDTFLLGGVDGTDIFNQSAGANTFSTNLILGGSGTQAGTYNFSAGTINATSPGGFVPGIYIGYHGTGTFNQTGGTVTTTATAPLNIAEFSGSTGTYILNGAGAVATIGGDAHVGGSISAVGGAGQLNISAGSMSVANVLKVWNSTGTAVNLSGGALSVGSIDTDGNSAHFNWTGGQLTIGGDDSSSTLDAAGSGSGSLVKAGVGTLTLTGDHTYNGGTTISAGTLQIGAGGTTGSVAGDITNNAAVRFNRSNALTFAGTISGTGSLAKSGAGMLTLPVANTYMGTTTISGGTLRVTHASALGSGASAIAVNSGTLEISGVSLNRPLTLNSGSGLRGIGTSASYGVASVNSSAGTTLSTSSASDVFTIGDADNDLTSSGGGNPQTITIAGPGTVALRFANDYSRNWQLDAGTLRIGNASSLGTSANAIGINAGALEIDGTDTSDSVAATTLNRTITLNSGATLRGTGTAASNGIATVASSASITLASGPSASDLLTIGDAANDLAGGSSATIAVTGGGKVKLPLANSYAGNWQLNSGTLRVENATAMGTGTSAVVINSGALEIAAPVFISRNLTLNNGATIRAAGSGSSSAHATGIATVTSGANITLASDNNGTGVLFVNNLVGGGGGSTVTVAGTGRIWMASPITYTGTWIINSGAKLVSDGDSPLGNNGNAITFNGGTLQALSSFNTAARHLTVNAPGGTFDANGYDSTFGNVTGTGTLTKSAGGKLSVNYLRTGGLNVTGGTVKILANSGASGVSTIPNLTIASGAKLDLTDNKLVTSTALGTESAGVYSGVQGMVQSALNPGGGGQWDGTTGLTTSQPDATTGLTTIGVSTGALTKFLGPTDTDTWAGQTINGNSTLAMYTYAGDADLNGLIDGNDYGYIDFGVAVAGADGYGNGDFNYDGVIDGNDYGYIDFNILAQGAPFYASGGLEPLTGVAAVPEPGLAGVVMVGFLLNSLNSRHRRRKL